MYRKVRVADVIDTDATLISRDFTPGLHLLEWRQEPKMEQVAKETRDQFVVDALFNVILIETRNQCTGTCWFYKFGQERQDPHTLQMNWQTIERIVGTIAKLA